MNFKSFRDKVFQLYNAAAYTEALAFIEAHTEQFPRHGHDIYFWRACLSCRAGDAEAGLAWLQEASDQGYWYHETMLRDRDLSVLHDGWSRCRRSFSNATPRRRQRPARS